MAGKIQKIQLEEMPVIPLWYNGLWAQYNNSVWTNWPSSESDNNYLPSTWRGYFQLGSILMLTELEPASEDELAACFEMWSSGDSPPSRRPLRGSGGARRGPRMATEPRRARCVNTSAARFLSTR